MIKQSWHVEREIPLYIVLLLIGNLMLGLVLIGAGYQRFKDLEALKAMVFTKADAEIDKKVLMTILASHDRRELDCENRLGRLEDRINQHTERDVNRLK